METLIIDRKTYKLLKWLKLFISTDHARPNLMVAHIVDDRIFVTDGYSLAVIAVSQECLSFTEFCKEYDAFEITALIARPRIAILTPRSINDDMLAFRQQIIEFIEENCPNPQNVEIAIGSKLLARLGSLPNSSGPVGTGLVCRFHIKDKNSPVTISIPKAEIILMPMFAGYDTEKLNNSD